MFNNFKNPFKDGSSMIDKIKDKLTIGNAGSSQYVVNMPVLIDFLNRQLNISIANKFEYCANLFIYYRDEKHLLEMWNLDASKKRNEHGTSVKFDHYDFYTLDNLLHSAQISGIFLKDIKDYFVIELINTDDDFLNEYKASHPELIVSDYMD